MLPTGWTEADLAVAGSSVHYYSNRPLPAASPRPTLLLAHGLTDNGLCWIRFAQAFATEFDLVMVDARNHGLTGDGPATLAQLTTDLAGVVTQLQLTSVIAVGHSVGACTVAALAAWYPQLVTALVLEDPAWFAKLPQQATNPKRLAAFSQQVTDMAVMTAAELRAQGQRDHPSWHDHEWGPWVQSKHQVRAHALAELDLGDWRDHVQDIQCPALLVFGDGDSIVTPQFAAEIVVANPKFCARQISNGGHNLRREQFQAFVKEVQSFLLGQDLSGPAATA